MTCNIKTIMHARLMNGLHRSKITARSYSKHRDNMYLNFITLSFTAYQLHIIQKMEQFPGECDVHNYISTCFTQFILTSNCIRTSNFILLKINFSYSNSNHVKEIRSLHEPPTRNMSCKHLLVI